MKAIVCTDFENNIGYENNLLFDFKEDKKFFKETTINKIVVMGGNTYRSIGKPLSNRINYVLTKDDSIKLEYPNIVFNNFDELLKECIKNEEDVFIIGGESIYKLFSNYIDVVYDTKMEMLSNKADAKFYYPKGVWKHTVISSGYCEKYKCGYYFTIAKLIK